MTFKVEKSWVTQAGLPAAVIWVNDSHRCGYIELTKDSVFYGVTNEREIQPIVQKSIDGLVVHGGVTFFGTPYWSDSKEDNSKLFVGFDCAHVGDTTRYNPTEGILRSLDYCIEECESLAKQLMSTDPVVALVTALEQIERWDGFPSTNETWEGSGKPVSYSAAFGSNGERDFMRGVASVALAAYRDSI